MTSKFESFQAYEWTNFKTFFMNFVHMKNDG